MPLSQKRSTADNDQLHGSFGQQPQTADQPFQSSADQGQNHGAAYPPKSTVAIVTANAVNNDATSVPEPDSCAISITSATPKKRESQLFLPEV